MRIDIMVDIETLGSEVNSTIFQISAIAFDIQTGEQITSFNKIADISKNESYDMSVTGSTLKWWLNTDKELLSTLLNAGEGTSTELLENFTKWLVGLSTVGEIYLWGNGILFDNNLLKHQLGDEYPIFYRNDRDVRTIADLACTKLNLSPSELRERYYDPSLKPHDALSDVTNQVTMVVACYKELAGWGFDESSI